MTTIKYLALNRTPIQSVHAWRFLIGNAGIVLFWLDAEGYVAFPRMNPAEDMVDLMAASRGYHANVSAMSAVKDMIQKSIDLLK